MKLILKDGTAIELLQGNNQNQFVVAYIDDTQLSQIDVLLTNENLSDAYYEINGTITDRLINKAISGSNKNKISRKVTYYLTDVNTSQIAELQEENIALKEKIEELETIVISLTTIM